MHLHKAFLVSNEIGEQGLDACVSYCHHAKQIWEIACPGTALVHSDNILLTKQVGIRLSSKQLTHAFMTIRGVVDVLDTAGLLSTQGSS